jgi:hypothetical protein
MKKLILLVLVCCAMDAFSQSATNSILIRHDTTTLKAEESEWIIKSLLKNDQSLVNNLGRTLPGALLVAIEKGIIKAYEPIENKLIPGKKIRTWDMPIDSIMEYDLKGEPLRIVAMQHERNSDHIDQIRIYQDWYYDVAPARFRSVIKWVELREKIITSQGIELGYAAICRIYY